MVSQDGGNPERRKESIAKIVGVVILSDRRWNQTHRRRR